MKTKHQKKNLCYQIHFITLIYIKFYCSIITQRKARERLSLAFLNFSFLIQKKNQLNSSNGVKSNYIANSFLF